MIPTSIDGTDITGATIDGQDVQEITVDGQTVFSAGPDVPGSVVHRYDARSIAASDGDPISVWQDLAGTDDLTDLEFGNPTFVSNGIDNQHSLDFGSSDRLSSTFATLTQPYYVFMTVNPVAGSENRIYDCEGSGMRVILASAEPGIGEPAIFANSWVGGSTSVTSASVLGGVYDGGSSQIFLNGSVVASGNASGSDLFKMELGGAKSTGFVIGEMLIGNGSNVTDVSNYLSTEWNL